MINKTNMKKIILLLLTLVVVLMATVSTLGLKDAATFAMSVGLIIIMLEVSRYDMKKSIYIFFVAMPILVTARKLLYLDLWLIKLNFESLMIIYFFVVNYKKIISKFNIINESKINKRFIYYMSFFMLASYVSCFFSKDIMDSFALNTTSVLVPTLFMITILALFEKSDIKNIVYALIISINLSCLYGFAQMAGIGGGLSNIKALRSHVTFGYHNTNIFVFIAMLVYPLLLNELFYKKNNKKENIFLICSLMLQTMAIALTFSRGAWLSLGLVFVAVLFSKKYKKIFIVICILGVISLPVVLPYIMTRGNTGSVSMLNNQSTTARIQSIYTSVEIMKDNVLGVGFGEFNNSYRDYAVEGYLSIEESIRDQMKSPYYTLEHAHNFFLQIAVEMGFLSLILIILILSNRLVVCIKNYKENRGFFVAIVMFIFLGITTGIELNHKGVVTSTYMLWAIFALVALNTKSNKDESLNINSSENNIIK